MTGSFVQPDSIVPSPMDPRAWNRFSYVYGNPVNYTDPSGHIPVPIIAAGIGLFALGGFGGHLAATSAGYEVGSWQWYGAVGASGLGTLASGGLGYAGYGLGAFFASVAVDTTIDVAILGEDDIVRSITRNLGYNLLFDGAGYTVGKALPIVGRRASNLVSEDRIIRSASTPDFYGIRSSNGEEIWVSSKPIDQRQFAELVDGFDGDVHILTGAHGNKLGLMWPEPFFQSQDLARWMFNRNVIFHNAFSMRSSKYFKRILNPGEGTR